MTLNCAHDVYSAHGSQFFNNIFCNILKFIKFSFFPIIDSQISGQGFVSIFDNTSYTFVIFFLFTSWSFTLISCDFTINESELCQRYFVKHDVLSQLLNFFLCALEKYFGSILMTLLQFFWLNIPQSLGLHATWNICFLVCFSCMGQNRCSSELILHTF